MLQHGTIIVHGGAGDLAADEIEGARAGCERAARQGYEVLRAGGSALDAVEAAVVVLEDDPRFNAGVGAALNREGRIEMDASIMRGDGLKAGGVGMVSGIRNPVQLARKVMEDGEHVLVVGWGAAEFAREYGIDTVPPGFHITERARDKLAHELRRRQQPGTGASPSTGASPGTGAGASKEGGTVGAVAMDAHRHVAAATSTGGTVAKRPGRIGDTPLPGAGTYADDLGGAASATGHGERIIQIALCKEAVERMRRGESAPEVAAAVVADLGSRVHGEGGVILVDRQGRVGFARNTRTMSFAYVVDGGDATSGV